MVTALRSVQTRSDLFLHHSHNWELSSRGHLQHPTSALLNRLPGHHISYMSSQAAELLICLDGRTEGLGAQTEAGNLGSGEKPRVFNASPLTAAVTN